MKHSVLAGLTVAASSASTAADTSRNLAPHPRALLPQKTHFDLQAPVEASA
jgi:hypothetical protein